MWKGTRRKGTEPGIVRRSSSRWCWRPSRSRGRGLRPRWFGYGVYPSSVSRKWGPKWFRIVKGCMPGMDQLGSLSPDEAVLTPGRRTGRCFSGTGPRCLKGGELQESGTGLLVTPTGQATAPKTTVPAWRPPRRARGVLQTGGVQLGRWTEWSTNQPRAGQAARNWSPESARSIDVVPGGISPRTARARTSAACQPVSFSIARNPISGS